MFSGTSDSWLPTDEVAFVGQWGGPAAQRDNDPARTAGPRRPVAAHQTEAALVRSL